YCFHRWRGNEILACLLFLRYAHNFLYGGVTAEHFNQTVSLHCEHALANCLILDFLASSVGHNQLLDCETSAEYFINTNASLVPSMVAFLAAVGISSPYGCN